MLGTATALLGGVMGVSLGGGPGGKGGEGLRRGGYFQVNVIGMGKGASDGAAR